MSGTLIAGEEMLDDCFTTSTPYVWEPPETEPELLRKHRLLLDYFRTTVPLIILDCQHLDESLLESHLPRYQVDGPQDINRAADVMMFGGADAGKYARDYAEAIALAALLAEGGITVGGLHFCRIHPGGLAVNMPEEPEEEGEENEEGGVDDDPLAS